LALLSLLPFWIHDRQRHAQHYQIQQHAVSLIPSTFLSSNMEVLTAQTFQPRTGFINSLIVSPAPRCAPSLFHPDGLCACAYDWKLRQPFFT
jgi:multiple sugar transport system permease protein